MIHIAVVEDDKDTRTQLLKYIDIYSKEHNEYIEVREFSDGADIVCDYEAIYDIIFLDIEMRDMDGMRAAKEIRKKDDKVVIIFVTNMAQYAIQGYSVNAMDFVLKPVSYFVFCEELSKAIRRLERGKEACYTIRQKAGLIRMNLSKVYYIESHGHKITFHTTGGVYAASGTMKELEGKFAAYYFSRCNNGYLVNLQYVEEIRGNEAVVAGELLSISRPRRKTFMTDLTNYLGGKI